MKILGVLALALFASSANAITIDPDDFATGTNLTKAIAGVTISGLYQASNFQGSSTAYNPVRGDVRAVECLDRGGYCPEPAGSAAFAFERNSQAVTGVWGAEYYDNCYRGIGGCQFGFGVIEVAFDSATSFVQATFAFRYDPGLILAYDADGNLLEVCGWYVAGNCSGVLTFLGDPDTTNLLEISLTRQNADIARIVVGALEGGAVLNQFAFQRSVPEPGTLGLLGLGLVGAWFGRRRRQSASAAPRH